MVSANVEHVLDILHFFGDFFDIVKVLGLDHLLLSINQLIPEFGFLRKLRSLFVVEEVSCALYEIVDFVGLERGVSNKLAGFEVVLSAVLRTNLNVTAKVLFLSNGLN